MNNPISYYTDRGWQISSDPHEYRESYPNGKRVRFGLRNYHENGKNLDAYCNGEHNAWDFYKADNTPIPSFADGIIGEGTRDYGTFGGQVLVIYPQYNIQVIYAHVKRPIQWKVGDKIKEGQTVARQGGTNNQGVSMSSHVHFQVQPIKAMGEWEFTCVGIDAYKIDLDKPIDGSKKPQEFKSSKHTVKRGETLYSISKQHNMEVDELKAINGLKDNVININQVLKLEKDASKPVTSKKPATSTTKFSVKKGSTLYSIAKLYGVTVDEIKEANNLKSNTIKPKQILNIPVKKKGTSIKKFNPKVNRGRSTEAYATGTIDSLGAEVRERHGSQSKGFNFDTKAGYSLKPTDLVHIFESYNGWLRIYSGDLSNNEFVWHERVKIKDTFK